MNTRNTQDKIIANMTVPAFDAGSVSTSRYGFTTVRPWPQPLAGTNTHGRATAATNLASPPLCLLPLRVPARVDTPTLHRSRRLPRVALAVSHSTLPNAVSRGRASARRCANTGHTSRVPASAREHPWSHHEHTALAPTPTRTSLCLHLQVPTSKETKAAAGPSWPLADVWPDAPLRPT
jgi:hypothetical protein